ncbi:MAG: competence/damage-inducible protein A, partial [Clostridiales bacterium]|nr:competence/damage-inducible protein A [Clostridiales bacterium]
MDAEILAVGTELLMGQITNTNARHISSRLPELGINVFYHTVVGDNHGRLQGALELALGRSDIVIMTGGLGPTMDDMTKEAVGACFGRRLVLHEESLERIRERMARFGQRRMTANNNRQAYFPEGAIILPNANGTAPGCIIEHGGKTVAMLPGPPSEMCPMFDDQVLPFLMKYAEYYLESKFVRVFGIGESMLEDMLKDLIEAQGNPTLATYAKEGEVT